ncbi:MAG: hypothetical protein WBQ20_15270, partial [Methyloceanibacter sp.]
VRMSAALSTKRRRQSVSDIARQPLRIIPNWSNHVAFMLHGGFATAWKPLEMLGCMSHNLVQHEASNYD